MVEVLYQTLVGQRKGGISKCRIPTDEVLMLSGSLDHSFDCVVGLLHGGKFLLLLSCFYVVVGR